MGSVTGIEFDGGSCLLVRVSDGGDRIRLSGVGGTSAEDWDPARPLVENLQLARRSGRFPRHARVVAWGLHETASASDPLTRAVLAPFDEAGFVIDAVLSPADALCALAERRPKSAGRAGEVWLALNRAHVAMAIVDGGRLLYSRAFDWHYKPAASQREDLLQRYSLVAHLAPEVRHGIDVVGAEHGASVKAIVTCGDLPDLRSLTMPLIEELDIEVETLDTMEGIEVERAAGRDVSAEQAPAIRLACAAASGAKGSGPNRWRLVAAAAILLAILAGAWTVVRSLSGPSTSAGPDAHASRPAGSITTPPSTGPTATQGTAGVTAPPQAPAPGSLAELPAPTPPQSTAATTGRTPPPAGPSPTDAPSTSTAGAPASAEVTAYQTPGQVQQKVHRDDAPLRRDPGASAAARAAARRQVPLTARLPVVNSILVAPDRRLAVLDGEIVREGDAVGRRVVARIESHAVVLREPSGHEVRVMIRRKLS
jgi:hypothetical protein